MDHDHPFVALFVWALIQAVFHRFLTVDETTLSVFKLMIKHRGLDPSKIPNAALIDIVVAKIGEAKTKALAAGATNGAATDWHRYLFRLLDEDAELIEKVLRNGAEKHGGSGTAHTLLKYGVIEPDYPPSISVERFFEATDNGTLSPNSTIGLPNESCPERFPPYRTDGNLPAPSIATRMANRSQAR